MPLRMQDHIRGCLAGLAVGDARGFPYEILSADEIRRLTGGQGVTGFTTAQQKKAGKKFGSTAHLPVGSTTDDTQLAAAIARSLIRCGRFSLLDQAREFLRELQHDTCGWGKTTQRAGKLLDKRLAEMTPEQRRQFAYQAPPPSKRIPGGGNGVAMKIAPLACFRFLRDRGFRWEPLLDQGFRLGLLTHGDPRASFAGLLVAVAIEQALQCRADRIVGPRQVRRRIRRSTRMMAGALEHRYRLFRPAEPKLSERLNAAYDLSDDPKRLAAEIGTGCFCLESVPFSLAMATAHLTDFAVAVDATVNCGGDTDTNAAMVGAIVGAFRGLAGIPEAWLRQVPDALTMGRLADDLLMAATRSIGHD